MDSYDLFAEDVGGGMLDGLAELGSDNFEPQATRDQQQAQQAQQQAQQQYSYPEHMHQESPLQKLASFGGEFASNHLEGGMYHGGTPTYGEAPRPMHPSQQYHTAAPQRSMMQQQGRAPPPSQYPSYTMQQDNLYSMDQQQAMTDWNYPGMRHYNTVQQQGQYRQTVQQGAAYQQDNKIQAQYSQAAAQPGMMISHQGYQQQRTQPQQQHYQQMYSGSGYSSYPMHQQAQPRMPHHMQQYQQQIIQETQYPQHFQQQASIPRPIGVEVASTASTASTTPQYKSGGTTHQGSSPQYRAPFPQLSPQMSPRQMSPRPQMSSPRPVVSPAKPQPNLSPRHKPSTYPPQTTLQQLEQLVMPPSAPQDYPQYRPQQWPTRQQHNGPDMSSFTAMEDPKSQNLPVQNDIRVPTPHADQSPSIPEYPQRDKFSSPSHMSQTPELTPQQHEQPSSAQPSSNIAKPIDTGQSLPYPDISFQNGNKMEDIMNHSEKALGDLSSSATGALSMNDQSALQQPPQAQQPQSQQPQQQQQPQASSQIQQAHPQQQQSHQTPPGAAQYPNTGFPGDVHIMQQHHAQQQQQQQQQSQSQQQQPPQTFPEQTSGSMYPSPISHQQEMAALRQQLQEAYCMPPAPDTQMRVTANIQHLQERINMLQHHEANDQCVGGPHCLLQSPMWLNSPQDPLMQRGRGRGRGRGGSGVGRPRKPRKKAGSEVIDPTQSGVLPPMGSGGMMPGGMMGGYMGGMVGGPPAGNMMVSGHNTMGMMQPVNQEMSQPGILANMGQHMPAQPEQPIMVPDIPPSAPSPPPLLAAVEPAEPQRIDRSPQPQEEPPPPSLLVEGSPPQGPEQPMPLLVAEAPVPDQAPPPLRPVIGPSSPVPSYDVMQGPPQGGFDDRPSSVSPVRELSPPPPTLPLPISSPPHLPPHTVDSSNVFNFTDDEELPPPPLHGDGEKKKPRKHREPKKPKEAKPPKEPKVKVPKEPKAAKTPRAPKTPKEPRKKREPKLPSESPDEVTPKQKRGPKKKKKEEIPEELNTTIEEELNTTGEVDEGTLSRADTEEDKETEASKEGEELEEGTPKKSKSKRERSSKPKGAKKLSKGGSQSRKSKKAKGHESEDGPGSPIDDDTNKRRSARNTQRKKYVDDIMLSISDEENSKLSSPKLDLKQSPDSSTPVDPSIKPNFIYVNPTEEDSMVVQTILAARKGTREIKIEADKSDPNNLVKSEEEALLYNSQGLDKKELVKLETKIIEVEEYYVKYRNFSYLHCEWKSEDELFKGDKRIAAKIKRFKQKLAHQTNIFENLEEDPFNPDYVEVERVLDVSELPDPNSGATVKHYLVKWRALQYEDSTWELQDDVDPAKIEQFERFNKIPNKDQLKPKKKPTGKEWVKLEVSPVYKNDNTLRDYQLEGLNWLLFSWYNGRNCILADEMGLGKTIQSLTFIHAVYEYGIRGPFLVIAPLSTIPNWQREFEAWTDLNVVVYHGSAASRNMLQEYELYFRNEKGVIMKDVPKVNVLITTFEIIITDIQDLKDFNWRICVIDEAHRLKNRNCKLLEGLRLLNLEHRVLLSGTPLQNNVNELFSLLNFLEPQQFNSCDAFLNEFGALKTETEVQKLQLLLKPMMLRRLKEDVEKTLAPKEETVVEVELTNIQKKYYRGILERNFSFLSKGTSSANVPNLMNTMMELRKCCIHPYLLNGAEDQIQHDYKQSHGEDPDAYYKALIHSSGKMVLIDKLLPKLKDNGHRVLIFSQMVRCLDILEDYLMYRKYPFERIDGRIRGNMRQAAIDRFCKPDSDRFVFLLCTKAGGLGINLTAADTVIIYDSDWNPQNDLQAQARCHRIGQQKMVKVYRLLCRNTYEREMFDKASLKLGLDKAILQSMNTSQGSKDPNAANKQLSKKEIEDLLKKGAYGAIMDEDNAADKFCEEDIDQILERRTQVITLESEKGSTFSKASFTSSGIRHDIDIDDPDFWKKWAKKADIDTSERDEQSELLLHEPRRRTQIKRYGHDDAVMDISDLESSSGAESDNDNEASLERRGRKVKNKLKRNKFRLEDYQTSKEGDMSYGTWARSECFKVERGLLTFGWGRWQEILAQNQFREGWRESDIEECARVIILYCLRFYRGDDKIRTFIWELITPPENGENSSNHSANIPRGRKAVSRRMKTRDGVGVVADEYSDHWSRQERYDGDIFLESNYRKHLSRHANKLLLRVRMLYYIKHEIIGDLVQTISEGTHISCLGLSSPHCDQSTSPAPWWDRDADKSLVVGTYKHGYEGYNRMRADPSLSFLAQCGPPSDQSLNEEMRLSDEEEGEAAVEAASSTASGVSAPSTALDSSKPQWPSMGDLNHRLRRVINSYQRNFKKEELKLAQKAKGLAGTSSQEGLAAGHPPTQADLAALMAAHGWDWHQLAIYLWKMERREKYEQMARERERQKLEVNQRKWSRREEQDFYRTVSSYGVDYNRQKKKYDWTKFRMLARLEKKFDDTMTEYYLAFSAMCKRVCGIKPAPEEERVELTVEPVTEERARRVLERIALLSKIREEILVHPQLDERLALCKPSADTPDWWQPAVHDKDLLIGVSKHGLGRTDIYILNDPELSFYAITQKNVIKGENPVKVEKTEDLLHLNQNEIVVKLEKGEGTLKIEKVGVKEEDETKIKEEVGEPEGESKPEEGSTEPVEEEAAKPVEIESKEVEQSVKECEPETELQAEEIAQPKEQAEPDKAECLVKVATDIQGSNSQIETKEPPQAEEIVDTATKQTSDQVSMSEDLKEESSKDENIDKAGDPPITSEQMETEEMKTDSEKTAKPGSEEKTDTAPEDTEPKKEEGTQVSKGTEVEGIEKFKALFPELEVMQKLPEIDTSVVSDKQTITVPKPPLDTTVAQIIAHSYQNHIKWPKEHALQVRLEHIVHAIETGEWPVGVNFSAYSECGTSTEPSLVPAHLSHHLHQLAAAAAAANDHHAQDHHSEVITITTDHGVRPSAHHSHSNKRKRHIAIDVETERAKLHALLNSTSMQGQHGMKSPWDHTDESLSEDSRRSTPGLQPPPAHQQQSTAARVLSLPFDLSLGKVTASTPVASVTPSSTPPSSGGVLDLSAKCSPAPAHSSSSVASTPPASQSSGASPLDLVQDFSLKNKQSKSKLDDTLNKLMQRKNCPVEEPVVGKEKKRRKLDEIVLGLSAAKEQMKVEKREVSPSVTVTVSTGKPPSRSSTQSTGSPSPKEPATTPLSAYLEQHNQLLRQQHTLQQQILQQQQALKQPNHHRKTYDQMIADITKVADFSAKMSSFSNEAKVNKWLAEQSSGGSSSTTSAADAGLSTADFLARRRRPRVDPTLLDWKKLTGEENVSVINKLTGKKLTGSKAPQLKRLAQWLLENPMYDVDPKWAELVKERGNLPPDLAKRVTQASTSSVTAAAAAMGGLEQATAAAAAAAAAAANKKGPGRPPLLSSPPSTGSTPTTAQSNLPFSSLAGINPALLSLGGFDPKNNPLLFPFGGMSPALSGLTNMNLTNSLFANLASLGLPNLAGMESLSAGMASAGAAAAAAAAAATTDQPGTSKQPKAQPRKPDQTSSKNTPTSSSLQSSLPFFFPNPGLLYSPLSLGGLNPFSLQPGGAYDSLGLLNGGLSTASSLPRSSSSKTQSSSSAGRSSSNTVTTSMASTPLTSSRARQQFMLPQDTQLLESLTRAAKATSKPTSHPKQSEVDSLRNLMAAASLPGFKLQDKEALEALSRTSADLLFSRLPQEQPLKKPDELIIKRKRESTPLSEDLSSVKKAKAEIATEKKEEDNISEKSECLALTSEPPSALLAPPSLLEEIGVSKVPQAGGMEQLTPVSAEESLVVPSAPEPEPSEVRSSPLPERAPSTDLPPVEHPPPQLNIETTPSLHQSSTPVPPKEDCDTSGKVNSSAKKGGKSRGKKGSPVGAGLVSDVVEKKNLRSSAGRAAAAAAARQRAASLEQSDP